ncbi:MAG: peptidylprolyl isomerase [Pirellulales bacterium]
MSRREAYRSAGRAAQRKRWFRMGFAAVAIVGTCVAVRYAWPPYSASADDENYAETAGTPAVAPRSPDEVAVVNGEKIMRAELAAECLRHYGAEVLETLVNKELIAAHCVEQGVTIEEQEIDAEIARLAQRFQVPVDQWLEMLQKERDVNPEQYRRDIIWPTIALRKLASGRLQVTEQELREAFEMEYGPQVKARMIGVRGERAKAIKIQQQAKANPKDFGRLARAESADAESASANGWIQPIRLHAGDKKIEDVAFALKDGEVSEIITIGDQHIILLCEGHVPPRQVKIEDVADRLAEAIRDTKLRDAAADLFKQLQKNAKVVNVLNDEPLKKQMPGVAATINGRPISIKALSEECLTRHGKDALNGLVNRRMIEQTLRKNNVKVNGQDIDDEIAEAAARMVGKNKDGQPDVEKWLEEVTKEPGVTVELYVRDAVWPSVAMKALCKAQVKITDADLAEAFEANYGERVSCLAILLDDQRKAQRVWEIARQDPSPEAFGKLSAEHSTDASVRALNGEIPPIGKHGGRPMLEEQAFALKTGELSGIIQSDGKFVILLSLGRTTPPTVTLKDVHSQLYDHVYRVKLNDAMGKLFDQMQQTATVTNYLDASKSRRPAKPRAAASTAARSGSTATR